MVIVLFAFLAGLVTVLAPCILPVLPIVLSGGTIQGRWRPWGIILGVVVSFSVFTLTLSWLVRQFGLSPEVSRWFGISILFGLGVLMLIPAALQKFEGWLSARLSRSGGTKVRHGFGGGVLLGLSLGAVWTPCAGPILAAVVSAAQSGEVNGQLVAVTVAYAIGAALPMGLIAALGQRLLGRVRWFLRHAVMIQQSFGVVIIMVAVLMATGLDRRVQAAIIRATPQWLPQLQQFENQVMPNPMFRPSPASATSGLPNYGPAPELTGIAGWINSNPLTLNQLRGRVVLIDFWTYSCINCIRTLPYLQAWHERYLDKGLTIIGVHTPEFEFEKVRSNVVRAVQDFKLTYPIALDPDYATWRAFRNQYWPAKYLMDVEGNIRYLHFGEGKYEQTETVIQQLLQAGGLALATGEVVAEAGPSSDQSQTPETYFGIQRAQGSASTETLQRGPGIYHRDQDLALHRWSLEGSWEIHQEYAEAGADAAITFHVRAKQVYFVMSGSAPAASPVTATIDGQTNQQLAIASASIDTATLYQVANFPSLSNHILRLHFPNGGVRLYAATFGSSEAPGMTCAPDGRCSIIPIQ